MPDRNDMIWSGMLVILLVIGGLAFLPLSNPTNPLSSDARISNSEPLEVGPWVSSLEARMRRVPQTPAGQAETRSPLDGYALIGLIESEGDNWAMISIGNMSQTLKIGSVLEGYELRRIEQDRVVFVRDGDEVVLLLAR